MKKKTLVVSIVCILSILCSSLLACKPDHVHQFEKAWEYDADYHWHAAACEHEEEISGKAAHDYRENGVCKICQYKRTDGGNGNIELPTKEFSSELLRDEVPAPGQVTVTQDGINYTMLPDGTYEIVSASSTATEIVIPDQINGADVTSIAQKAFENNTRLQSITLSSKIKKIGNMVFNGCSALTTVNGADSLEVLGTHAFNYCAKLTTFNFPALKSMGMSCFYGCTSLGDIEFPATVESIGPGAFYGCTGIGAVTLPDSVKHLGFLAFSGCTALTEFVIPDSVKEIDGEGLLADCSNIQSITVPFLGRTRDEAASIGFLFDSSYTANYKNPEVGHLTVPRSLTSITITDSTQLGDFAFYGLSQLETLVVNDEIAHVGNGAFVGCTGLAYTVERNGNYVGNEANPYMILANVADKTVTSFTINPNTKHIAGSAFAGCTSLSSLSIPNGIESVGANAFADCTSLSFYTKNNTRYLGNSENQFLVLVRCTTPSTSFTFEQGTTVIAGGAFKSCANIQSINIPDRIKSIGGETFMGCAKLANIVVPASVKAIGVDAFGECLQIANITAPAAALNNIVYDTEEPPLQYLKNVTFTSGEYIKEGIFYECPALEKVTLSETFDRIYEYAFYNCAALKQINLPDTLERIDQYAFYGCNSLEACKMPDNLKTVGMYAFYQCYSFGGQLILPEGLETLDDGAFEQTAVTDVYIGANLKSFGPRTFGLLEKLVNVMVSPDNDSFYSVGNCIIELGTGILRVGTSTSVIPQGEGQPVVTSIGATAFYGRMNLTSLNIPKSVTSFGDSAFFSCAYLSEINYEGTLAEWEAITKPDAWTTEVATAYEGREFTVHCSDGDKTEVGKKSSALA